MFNSLTLSYEAMKRVAKRREFKIFKLKKSPFITDYHRTVLFMGQTF